MGTRRKMEKDDKVEDGVHESNHVHERSDLRGDETNIAILLFLYLLQGIPLGLCGSIPMLLQNRNVSYRQQVIYNIHMELFQMIEMILYEYLPLGWI